MKWDKIQRNKFLKYKNNLKNRGQIVMEKQERIKVFKFINYNQFYM